jgi:hypothetical protein
MKPSLHLHVKSMEQTPLPEHFFGQILREQSSPSWSSSHSQTPSLQRPLYEHSFKQALRAHDVPVNPGAQLHFASSQVPCPPHLFGQHFNGATPLAGQDSLEQSLPSQPDTHSQHFFGPHLPCPEQPFGQTFTAHVLPV